MSRASRAARVHELLAFDLALAGMDLAIDDEARLADAPLFFSETASLLGRSLVGFDEAGRGALAGPVVVGCVAFPPSLLAHPAQVELLLGGVDDSKALTPRAREAAYESVVRCARWAVGCASASEIDAAGIVAAAERAACRAYRRLGVLCDLAVFDRGLSLGEPLPLDFQPVVRGRQSDAAATPPAVAFTRGDMRSLHVAAASLVAKVTRDRLMAALDTRFRGYELAQHKGYGTPRHAGAIARLGPSPVHRTTFLRRFEEPKSQSC